MSVNEEERSTSGYDVANFVGGHGNSYQPELLSKPYDQCSENGARLGGMYSLHKGMGTPHVPEPPLRQDDEWEEYSDHDRDNLPLLPNGHIDNRYRPRNPSTVYLRGTRLVDERDG